MTVPGCLEMAVLVAKMRAGRTERVEIRLNPVDLPGITDVLGWKVVRSLAIPVGRAWVLDRGQPLSKTEVVLAIHWWRDQPPDGRDIARLEFHGGTYRHGMTAGEVADASYRALDRCRARGEI